MFGLPMANKVVLPLEAFLGVLALWDGAFEWSRRAMLSALMTIEVFRIGETS